MNKIKNLLMQDLTPNVRSRFGAGVNKDNVKLHLGSLMLDLGPSTGSGQVRDAIHIENFDWNDAFNSSSISSFEFVFNSSNDAVYAAQSEWRVAA